MDFLEMARWARMTRQIHEAPPPATVTDEQKRLAAAMHDIAARLGFTTEFDLSQATGRAFHPEPDPDVEMTDGVGNVLIGIARDAAQETAARNSAAPGLSALVRAVDAHCLGQGRHGVLPRGRERLRLGPSLGRGPAARRAVLQPVPHRVGASGLHGLAVRPANLDRVVANSVGDQKGAELCSLRKAVELRPEPWGRLPICPENGGLATCPTVGSPFRKRNEVGWFPALYYDRPPPFQVL